MLAQHLKQKKRYAVLNILADNTDYFTNDNASDTMWPS